MRCAVALGAMIAVAGCADAGRRVGELTDHLHRSEQTITALRAELAECKHVRRRQAEQITTLQGLGPQRLENLVTVDRIALGRFTGGYDGDGDGDADGVKVFLRPIDADGVPLKAAGEVTIALFDLPGEGEKLAEHRFGVDRLGEHFRHGPLIYHYSFECPWSDRPPSAGEVTVRAAFVELLTGRTFSAQTLVKVQSSAASSAPANGSP